MLKRMTWVTIGLIFSSAAAFAQVHVVRGIFAGNGNAPAPAMWQPVRGNNFDVQLNDPKKASDVPFVRIVELDIDIDQALLDQIKARKNTRLLCYFSAGSWEDYRDDKNSFPAGTLGNDYDGYPHERWLDIRQISALAPVMRARINKCKSKGFDGIDPDNVDGYDNSTGFPLSQADQLAYNRWLKNEAHARNLAIALKNAPGLAAQLNSDGYDLAVTESCFKYNFCSAYAGFIGSGKPVLDMEYKNEKAKLKAFCPQAKQLGISAILKNKSASIDKFRQPCPE